MDLITQHFTDHNIRIKISSYHTGHTAITIQSAHGNPLATATVNIPDLALKPHQVLIKNYSENDGILASLCHNGVVNDTGFIISNGYAQYHLCELTKNYIPSKKG